MAEKPKLGSLTLWSYEKGLLECDTVKFGGCLSPTKQQRKTISNTVVLTVSAVNILNLMWYFEL